MFAGGSFTKINGIAQKSLVKLRLSDGARITAFKGKTNARVKDMAVSGGRLYIGGTFKTANGVARSALAAVDPVTGALPADVNLAITDPGAAPSTSTSSTSSSTSQVMIAIGNWTYGRPARPDRHAQPGHQPGHRLATTRYRQQCAKVFGTYMRDIDISPDGSYFVVGTTGAYRVGKGLRRRRPLGDRRHRRRPAADLGRLHRRRHPVQRGRHRDRGLRGRTPGG